VCVTQSTPFSATSLLDFDLTTNWLLGRDQERTRLISMIQIYGPKRVNL
jgi:hypothetical protein